MPAAATPPGELEPIETASQDELRALQLGRPRWSLRHAYENVPGAESHVPEMYCTAVLAGPVRPVRADARV